MATAVATAPIASTPFELAHFQPAPGEAQRNRKKGLIALFSCACAGDFPADCESTLSSSGSSDSTSGSRADIVPHLDLTRQSTNATASPRKSSMLARLSAGRKLRLSVGRSSSDSYYSDAASEWHDAASTFSSYSIDQDQAGIEEVVNMVKELGSFKADWIPSPPLAFGTPGMQFVPVPAVTGFAAYWLRDDARTTPFPQPIDVMIKASFVAQKVHESIPGILIEETDTELSIIAKPSFLPKFLGINGYAEQYDKSNKNEHSWTPRRDLRMGKAYGKLYMTADGMLIARVWQKGAFSDKVDTIMEEYMRLEDNGTVIVDRMTCLHVESGKRASQYQVGFRRPLPTK